MELWELLWAGLRLVQKICQSCYFHIFSIGNIRHLLNNTSTEILVHAFITSRLDNGSALLYGTSEYLLAKLQRVQNAAARLITRTKKQEHITPVLVSLYWLPIKQRIHFKLLLLPCRVIHSHGSSYLAKLLKPHEPSRQLRSADKNLLVVPRSKSSSYGDRAFSCAVPRLWNALPDTMRKIPTEYTFKKCLKTMFLIRPTTCSSIGFLCGTVSS